MKIRTVTSTVTKKQKHIEKGPFEPLKRVEVAVENESNASRKMVTFLAHKRKVNIADGQIKRKILSLLTIKT